MRKFVTRLRDSALPPRVVVAREVEAIVQNRGNENSRQVESLIGYMLEYFHGTITPQQVRENVFPTQNDMLAAPSPITEAFLKSIPDGLITVVVVRFLVKLNIKMPNKTDTWKYFVARYHDVLVCA